MAPGDFYSMFEIEGRPVAAAYTLRPDAQSRGVPPYWMIYVAVDNADDSARRATELGGKVMAGPFDVYDVGRMAAVQDPTGAAFSIWQAKQHIGAGIIGRDGTLCWADLTTPDPARAAEFYSGLFGWKLLTGEKDPSGYLHIKNGEAFIGGIPPIQHQIAGVPPHWMLYFQVADCDATAAQAKQLGATFRVPPMTMENVGRFAILADPQGATFAIFQQSRSD